MFHGSAAKVTLRSCFAAALVAYGAAAVVLPHAGVPPTTFGAVSRSSRAADLAAGLGLLAAALVASTHAQRRRTALLAALAGVLWFGLDWEGWSGGPPLVRSLGAMAPPLLLAVLFQLAVAFPDGRPRGRPIRAAVAAVYATALVVVVGRTAVRDPFLDPGCWRNCLDNTFLLHRSPTAARLFADLWQAYSLAAGLALIFFCARRLHDSSRAARRLLWTGLVAGALVGLAMAAGATTLSQGWFDGPRSVLSRFVFDFLSLSVLALAAAVCWSVAVGRRRRHAIRGITADLAAAPVPGRLAEMLAAAVGDPTLTVLYPLVGPEHLVDGMGHAAALPPPGRGRTVTPLTRGGKTVAVVVHDSAVETQDLAAETGAALRLAIDNERLQANVLAQLDALRASRARIVAAGDAERRRLERNLHDGAQQRLLALIHQLRLARSENMSCGHGAVEALLAQCASEAEHALDELRRIAQGIYPAILAEAGLRPALATLVDTAPLAVELALEAGGRYPVPVEAAAFATALAAIDDAAARRAGVLEIEARQEDNELVISLTDDGSPRSEPPLEIDDRVGALGGSVHIESSTLTVRVPCG